MPSEKGAGAAGRESRRTSARIPWKRLPKRVTPVSMANPPTRSVVIRPPTRVRSSSTSGRNPRAPSRSAAPRPATPPPMIRTSGASSLRTASGDEIDGGRRARVRDVREVLAHGVEPLLAPGHMVDDRSEDHKVVDVGAVLEEQRPTTRTEDSLRFCEELLAGFAVRDLVRAEAEDYGVAARGRDRERERARTSGVDPRVGGGSRLEVTNVSDGGLGGRPVDVPRVDRVARRRWEQVRGVERRTVGSDVQIGPDHSP